MIRKATIVSFTVTGRHAFPLDMLRYDCCWPATSDDVVAMCEEGQRTITLRGAAFTPGRWASFGWTAKS